MNYNVNVDRVDGDEIEEADYARNANLKMLYNCCAEQNN